MREAAFGRRASNSLLNVRYNYNVPGLWQGGYFKRIKVSWFLYGLMHSTLQRAVTSVMNDTFAGLPFFLHLAVIHSLRTVNLCKNWDQVILAKNQRLLVPSLFVSRETLSQFSSKSTAHKWPTH